MIIHCMSDLPEHPNAPETAEPASWPRVADLLEHSQLLRVATSGGTANVYVYEKDGRKYLVKSFAKHNFFMRWLFGKFTIRNEWRILKALEAAGISGVPHGFALLEDNTLVMEFASGTFFDGQFVNDLAKRYAIKMRNTASGTSMVLTIPKSLTPLDAARDFVANFVVSNA